MKFGCVACGANTFSSGQPGQCERCGGLDVLPVDEVSDAPSALHALLYKPIQHRLSKEDELKFYQEYQQWSGETR